MKRSGALLIATWLFVISCSRGDKPASDLAGHWVLARQCVCNICSDSVGAGDAQTLDFTSDGQVQLTGAVGNSVRSYSGTYFISGSKTARILTIDLDAPDSLKHFLDVPGSQIVSVSAGNLVLTLSTPFANPCQFQNTYALISQ